ncbi:uncharacterized protein LOC120357623 [Solenopsis invicta]|uniref:uncharacterized protein LOC120357623 n=1 Tax=Solenopsis invicta TaxID=13686 RepID=UPI00193C8822|nr:uncharacterized protein LOC120357623 [Solenopsis invicta]
MLIHDFCQRAFEIMQQTEGKRQRCFDRAENSAIRSNGCSFAVVPEVCTFYEFPLPMENRLLHYNLQEVVAVKPWVIILYDCIFSALFFRRDIMKCASRAINVENAVQSVARS